MVLVSIAALWCPDDGGRRRTHSCGGVDRHFSRSSSMHEAKLTSVSKFCPFLPAGGRGETTRNMRVVFLLRLRCLSPGHPSPLRHIRFVPALPFMLLSSQNTLGGKAWIKVINYFVLYLVWVWFGRTVLRHRTTERGPRQGGRLGSRKPWNRRRSGARAAPARLVAC